MLHSSRIFPIIFLGILTITSSFAQNYQDSIEQILQTIADNPSVTGFSVSIIRDGEVKYMNGFGLADEHTKRGYTAKTIQNIASISKTFIGVSLMKAQALNLLNLDDPIDKYLPYKSETVTTPLGSKIMQLSHENLVLCSILYCSEKIF